MFKKKLPTLNGNNKDVEYGAAYLQMRLVLRIATGYAAMLTVAFCVLAGFTAGLFPLKKIEPQFVFFSDKQQQVVTVEPGHITKSTKDALIEATLTEYVTKREAIDKLTDSDRFAWVARASAQEVFSTFRKVMDISNENSPLKKYYDNNMSREIHVVAVYPNNEAEQIYTVEYITTDRRDRQPTKQSEYVATIQFTIQPIDTSSKWATQNPLGLIVTGYSIKARSPESVQKASQ